MSDAKPLPPVPIGAVWISEQLAAKGLHLAGAMETVHLSLTSQVVRMPITNGDLFFKAAAPLFQSEAAITAGLAERFPQWVPPLLGIDAARGWLLMENAGQLLRPLVQADGDLSRFEVALDQAAALQQQSAAQVDSLLALGVPDRRLDQLPALYRTLITDRDVLLVGLTDGLSEAELDRARAFVLEVDRLCAELAADGLPATLHHDDFHDRNTAWNPVTQSYHFFDWAECAVTHPFCQPMIFLRGIKYLHHQESPVLDRLRDHYLAAWATHSGRTVADLLPSFERAQRIAALNRALTWAYVLNNVEGSAEEIGKIADSAAYWLRLFLDWDTSTER